MGAGPGLEIQGLSFLVYGRLWVWDWLPEILARFVVNGNHLIVDSNLTIQLGRTALNNTLACMRVYGEDVRACV